MNSFLYYSLSSSLTEDEILEIDNRVLKNREGFYLFVKELPSNSKVKVKKLFVYGMFVFQLGQPLVPCAAVIILPLPPTAIHRLSPIEQDIILSNKNAYPQIASIPESKVNKIRLTNDQIQEFNWIRRKDFLLLIKKFIHNIINIIDFEEFETSFTLLYWKAREEYEYERFHRDLKRIEKF